ncbi:MAG: glycosyltransferase, partial [Nitriliruptorales bacterium]
MRVVAVSGTDPGHLIPVVAVAVALRARGHDVSVVTGGDWRADVEASDLAFLELPRLEPDEGDADLGWRLWGRAEQMAGPLATLLRDTHAEAVVTDTLVGSAGFAAELAGIPWVDVVPHFLWEPSRHLPPVGLGQRPARSVVGRLLERQQRRMQAASFAEGSEHRTRVRAALGLTGLGGPVLRLVATLPGLEPPRPDWPRRTFLVGALEWDPPGWTELPLPDGGGPLVVVTDSTAGNVQTSVARAAVAGLAGEQVRTSDGRRGVAAEDVRLVVTSGSVEVDEPGVVVGQGPHGPLLDAAACAVGSAGHGFVTKALVRGVPLVLVPLHGDQRETAARVARAGAGVTVPPDA